MRKSRFAVIQRSVGFSNLPSEDHSEVRYFKTRSNAEKYAAQEIRLYCKVNEYPDAKYLQDCGTILYVAEVFEPITKPDFKNYSDSHPVLPDNSQVVVGVVPEAGIEPATKGL